MPKRLPKKMKDVFGCDGVNIVQNNGVAAGQTVFHFHIHLIPRYEGDHAGVTWKPGTLTDEGRRRDSAEMEVTGDVEISAGRRVG